MSTQANRTTKIAIIGAGNVGGNLGSLVSKAGYPVRFGVRDGSDTKDVLAKCAPDAAATDSASAAAWADVVFLAVPGTVSVAVAKELAKSLEGKIVVDCNNPVSWSEGGVASPADRGPIWAPPPEGSLAAAIAKAAPGSRVVKGFNQFGAEFHGDPALPGGGADVFLAADDAEAKKLVSELATAWGFRPVDAGPLRNAAVLENVATMWIHLAIVGGQGRDFVLGMRRRER